MTTFTTEDRIIAEKPPVPTEEELAQIRYNQWQIKWGKDWVDAVKGGWNTQTTIQYFWPLTEQEELGLNFEGCEKPKLTTVSSGSGVTFCFPDATWGTTTINSNILSINPSDPVGQLSIGGVHIGIEKKPSWLQKQLYKLMGFNWKDK